MPSADWNLSHLLRSLLPVAAHRSATDPGGIVEMISLFVSYAPFVILFLVAATHMLLTRPAKHHLTSLLIWCCFAISLCGTAVYISMYSGFIPPSSIGMLVSAAIVFALLVVVSVVFLVELILLAARRVPIKTEPKAPRTPAEPVPTVIVPYTPRQQIGLGVLAAGAISFLSIFSSDRTLSRYAGYGVFACLVIMMIDRLRAQANPQHELFVSMRVRNVLAAVLGSIMLLGLLLR